MCIRDSNESTKSCIDAGVHNIIHGRWFDKSLDKSYKFEENYSKKISEKGIFVDSTISKHLLEYESKLKGEKQRKPNPNVIKSEPTLEEIINIFRRLDQDNVDIINSLQSGSISSFDAGQIAAAANSSLQEVADTIRAATSAGVSVDLEATAQGLGYSSFADAVAAYNAEHGTNYTVDEAKESLGQ